MNAYLLPWKALEKACMTTVSNLTPFASADFSYSAVATMEEGKTAHSALNGKHSNDASPNNGPEDVAVGENTLHRELKGRHMQMIAM